uniref:WD repeat-containing protein 44 n=1 Tax=Phallusia mammillata TaxID=59560 RepID=A0A6F9DW78_9ASCI|nr:WD repeat-containing protein 44-like [Phallusia mammillata]
MSVFDQGSDSDEFYDTREEFGSPRCPSSPILVSEEESPEKGNNQNLNSPSHAGGNLSLDYLLQDKASTFVFTEPSHSGYNAQIESKEEVSTQQQPLVDQDLTETQQNAPSDGCAQEEDSKNVEHKVDPIQVNGSKPDLVACTQERPADLPGVKPVLVAQTDEPTEDVKPPSRQGSTKIHLSLPRPNRPPPPRPKAPPKRPPPPKSAPANKTTFSSGEDGLMTPNTTVDNITKEFADALNKDAMQKQQPMKFETNETNSVKSSFRKSFSSFKQRRQSHESVQSTESDATTVKDKVQPTNTATTQQQQTTHNKHDEVRDENWSEITKNTVLRIDSSPPLEILSTVIVRNLDTGQTMPLSVAAEQVSQCLNPLALQIMSRTKEFSCATGGATEEAPPQTPSQKENLASVEIAQSVASEEETMSVASDDITIGLEVGSGKPNSESSSKKIRTKSKRFKKIIGKGARRMKAAAETKVEKAVQKVKQAKQDGSHAESLNVSTDEEISDSFVNLSVKTKNSSSHKGPYHFTHLKMVQDIAVHVGAVWSMKFSHCGRLLATAGQNNIIWIWVLKEWFHFFNDMRKKYDSKERGAVFATPPRGSMDPPPASSDDISDAGDAESDQLEEDVDAPFKSLPFSSYFGHTADVLDLAWSKNYFTLSSSMDKTVRLWHVSQKECLCCFQHIDFVTAISFHPRDDRYFLSGSLDGKLRLWNIPDKKVALWNEVGPDSSASTSSSGGGALITTVNFCENGKFAVCGTYDGRCLFYDTEHLKYHTQIHVRSSRGRNQKGHKITGIEPLANEHKILITSNDSRVRLYDLRDLSLTCKYRGLTNLSSQIKATFSPDNNFIICGSEDKSIFIWRTNLPPDVTKISSFRRDRNDCWESIRAHNAVVTCAIFAPKPQRREKLESTLPAKTKSSSNESYVIISADFNGVIKIFSTT